DRDHLVPGDGDVGPAAGRPGPIDQRPPSDDDVGVHLSSPTGRHSRRSSRLYRRTVPAPRTRSRFIDEAIASYASAHSTGPDQIQADLQAETAAKTGAAAGMQIGDDQSVLMELLVRAMGVRSAVEIGTF